MDAAQQPKECLLEARQIGRRTSAGQWLIQNIALSVYPGDRISIIGPTGSGKTVFLRSLAMLDEIQEGELIYQGTPLIDRHLPEFRSQVVYLQQRPVLLEGTVEENLTFALRFHANQHKPQDISPIIKLLNHFDRPDSFLQRHTSALSGGEGQIVALLRALTLSPQILLLDEPTSGLDPVTTRQFEEILHDWLTTSNHSPALVWITHDHAQARRVATKTMKFPEATITDIDHTHSS